MIVTEKKFIKIDRTCKTNPVFITWKNTRGGREYWLFHKVQTIGLDVQNGGDFEPYMQDLETSKGQILDVTKDATPKMIVGASVNIEDIEGIKTMLYSVRVEMLTNPETWQTEGPRWLIVRPNPGSFKLYDTNEIRSTIEITLDLPYIFNQAQ
jgi:hypothetical protein